MPSPSLMLSGLLALGFQELVDFSAQIPANAVLMAVVCGIALHHSPPRKARAYRELSG